MKEKLEVSRIEFNIKVQDFIIKNKCKTMLEFCTKHLPVTRVIDEHSVQYQFFSDPIIQGYLKRNSLEFTDKYPKLARAVSENHLMDSDEFELAIYEHRPDLVVFRNKDLCTDKFYSMGNLADKENQGLFNLFFKEANPQVFEIAPVMEIFQIAKDAYSRAAPLSKKETPAHFLLYPNWYGGHATTCLSILNPDTKQLILTVFINSQSSPEWYQFIKKLFYTKQSQNLGLGDVNSQEYFKKHFGIDPTHPPIDAANLIKVDEAEKAAFFFNAAFDYRKKHSNVYKFCETLYTMRKVEGSGYTIYRDHTPNTLLIDASLGLQTQEDDENCTLYSFNIINAIIKFLGQPARAAEVMSLAAAVREAEREKADIHHKIIATYDIPTLEELIALNTQNEENTSKLTQKFQTLFKEDIKAFLPCYYDAEGNQKPFEEIAEFHKKMRWDLGGEWLGLRFPPSTRPVQEFKSETKFEAQSMKDCPYVLYPKPKESSPFENSEEDLTPGDLDNGPK